MQGGYYLLSGNFQREIMEKLRPTEVTFEKTVLVLDMDKITFECTQCSLHGILILLIFQITNLYFNT